MLLHKQTVKNSGMAAIGSGGETMRIFTAIVNQIDGDPPVLTILVNTLGSTVDTVAYDGAGHYRITFTNPVFGINEVVSFTNGVQIGSGVLYAEIVSDVRCDLASSNGFASFEDNIITNASLIILIP